ncbi:uncharacterized protein PAC_17355 [Phialocephala subalpina]|uniref:FAD dependent oxidoreductase domain-containing protein n=1 Tax=Phialocephala subalpina TaxID=576137 RepID=A0A1L7XQX7_9HELO|nr:uncharacterized protein PAC_17355 [Phialocephala subalpina]
MPPFTPGKHGQPPKVLISHRSTEALPAEADVVIIRSGITGASAAHWLYQDESDKELKVVMLEAREACWGATGRNGGHCQPRIYDRSAELSSLEMRNYLTLQDLINKHDIACDWVDLSVVHGYMSQSLFEEVLSEYKSHLQSDPSISELIMVVTPSSTNLSLSDLRVSNSQEKRSSRRLSRSTALHFLRHRRGELIFGGGRAYTANASLGVSDGSSIDLLAAAYIRREISKEPDLHNGGEVFKVNYKWSGIIGFSKDDRPWVGELTEDLGLSGGERFVDLCCVYGHGMPNAFLDTKAVVELMIGRKDEEVDLPSVHWITKERVEGMRGIESVFIVDYKAGM